MELSEMQAVVAECEYGGYHFAVTKDGRGAIYLQGSYVEADVDSGREEIQRTRRWFLSPEMSKSEIVQTVFKCALTSAEHRCREWFRYRGKAVFGPHFNVDVLHAACKQKQDHRGA